MLDFLSAIADALVIFVRFIGNTFTGLGMVFSFASEASVWFATALGYIPAVFVGFAMLGVFLTLIFHFLGR